MQDQTDFLVRSKVASLDFIRFVLCFALLALLLMGWELFFSRTAVWSNASVSAWHWISAVAAASVGAAAVAHFARGQCPVCVYVAGVLAAHCGVIVWSLLAGLEISASAVAASSITAVALGVVLGLIHAWRLPWIVVLLVGIGVLAFAQTAAFASFAQTLIRGERWTEQGVIQTSLYTLNWRRYARYLPVPFASGGGLGLLSGGRILLVNGDGDLYVIEETESPMSLETQLLAASVPINAGSFRSFAESRPVNPKWFKVLGLHVVSNVDTTTIFVSHHYFRESEECVVVRVSMLEANTAGLNDGRLSGENWTTVYETAPCLPLKNRTYAFAGYQSGGRMTMLDESTLLLSVGDFEFDGVNSDLLFPQDPEVDYGKILAIDLQSGEGTVFSSGVRNPQGLVTDSDGRIWETEHGPQGGDELNLIVEGANYGWPLVTHGTNYGSLVWPLAKTQGSHAGYRQPAYSWVPSIGISNLLQARSELFRLWNGDLIVSSLVARTLFRVRLIDNRPVLVEPIQLPAGGVRDLIQGPNGDIVIWENSGGAIAFLRPSESDASTDGVFAQCQGCHGVTAGGPSIGPSLHNIFNRRIASVSGYDYSSALESLEGRWDDAALDRFLENPSGYSPGTSMMFGGLTDADARRQLIEYLKEI